MSAILDSIMSDDVRRNSEQYHNLMDEVAAWPMLTPFMRAMRVMASHPLTVSLICRNLLAVWDSAPPFLLRPLSERSRVFCAEMAQGVPLSGDLVEHWDFGLNALRI